MRATRSRVSLALNPGYRLADGESAPLRANGVLNAWPSRRDFAGFHLK